MQTQKFYSNGKLLLTGEYLVLDGALSLALPTRFGQSMEVSTTATGRICWTSFDADGTLWMREEITIDELINGDKKDTTTFRGVLMDVLRAAHQQNKTLLHKATGFDVTCKLTFPRIWGLGSSSTWINNVAQWFGINGFQLLADSFGGSGYDIACAQHNQPITYRRTAHGPEVEEVVFNPVFSDHLYFVYLNKKQSSKEAIAAYRLKKENLTAAHRAVNEITHALLEVETLADFQSLLLKHEALLQPILNQNTVQQQLFPDFPGAIKSLGAWGGDFVLVASAENPRVYFETRGFSTVIPYADLILKA